MSAKDAYRVYKPTIPAELVEDYDKAVTARVAADLQLYTARQHHHEGLERCVQWARRHNVNTPIVKGTFLRDSTLILEKAERGLAHAQAEEANAMRALAEAVCQAVADGAVR